METSKSSATWFRERDRVSISGMSHKDFHTQFVDCPVLYVDFHTMKVVAAGESEEAIVDSEPDWFDPGDMLLTWQPGSDAVSRPPAPSP